MNDNTNIIAVYSMVESTPLSMFVKTGKYKSVPIILYKTNEDDVKCFAIERPIEIFREDMYYNNINSFGDEGEISFLSMPSDAFDKMHNYVKRNVNKVVADMITYVVTKVIKECDRKNEKSNNVFFIDSSDTNKIIGRLGYLYLNNEKNNITFLTYKSSELLTDVLNSGNEKLKFDINYFKNSIYEHNDYSDIIPNDFMESMTQTVFYKIEAGDEKLSPLRCDIFSQGISKMEIKKKAEQLKEILTDKNLMTLPFKESESSDNWIKIPRVLKECHYAKEMYTIWAHDILEGKDEINR